MGLQITPNLRSAGRLSVAANQRARLSSVFAIDWDRVLNKPDAADLAAMLDSYFLTPAEGGAAYQPLDSDLTAIAALTTEPFGRSLLTLANAAALAAEVDAYAPLPPGFVSVMVSQAGDADHDITFAAGRCRDSTDARNIVLAAAVTKQIDAGWTVGNNQGGLDTGSVANNTVYYLWTIMRSDTGVVDALFSTSATAPTMPANYDFKQRVGAVLTDGSGNIVPFWQHTNDLDRFEYTAGILDVDVSNFNAVNGVYTDYALSVPPLSDAMIIVGIFEQTAWPNIVANFISKRAAANTPELYPAGLVGNVQAYGGQSYYHWGILVQELQPIETDAASEITAGAAAGVTDIELLIRTKGFIMRRGLVP